MSATGVDDVPIYGFLHVAALPGWTQIVREQLDKLRISGLYEKTTCSSSGSLGTWKRVTTS